MTCRALAAVALLGLGTVAAACGDSDDDAVDVDDLRGEFDGDTVEAAAELLGAAGIEVRVRPRDEPLVDVDARTPVQLLRLQVRNLALEVNAGGGLLGAELDAVMTEAGGDPVSDVIAGWARSGATPAAQSAAALLVDVENTDPRRLTVPGLVVAMFLSDLVGPTGAEEPPPAAGGLILGPSVAANDADFCADVTTFVSSALADVNDPGIELEPDWLADAVERAAAFEPDPQRLRNSVAAMSLYVYATSIARPWVPLLVANPLGGFHYQVGENEIPPTTEIRLSVDTGDGFIADEAEDCAALAGLELPESEVEGSDVLWLTEGLLPHVTIDDEGPGGDLELDENGSASWGFDPATETADAHKDGTPQSATVPVAAVIRREEIDNVRTAVRGMLTGGDLGVAAPDVVAMYERLDPVIEQLLYPRASTYATVTWHTPKPPDEDEPDPGEAGSGLGEDRPACGDGCAASNGDPHLVPISGSAYDFQAAGEFVLLRSVGGDVEIQARQVPVAGDSNLTLNTAIAARVGDHRIGIYARDNGIATLIDGDAVSFEGEVDLGAGARLVPYERGVEVTFADGTVMWALPRRGAVEILVRPSDDLRAGGVGLLGRSTADGFGLPAMPDGSPVPASSSRREAFELLYGEFEEAWRVTADTSLFDYDTGESTESFLVDDYPVRPLEYEDLTPDQIARGSEACDAVDLLPEMRRACILDVVVTGDAGYADMYALTSQVVAQASDGLGEPGPLIDALPAAAVGAATATDSDTGTESDSVSEVEAVPATLDPVPTLAGEPTLSLSGTVVSSLSDAAYEDGVETELRGAFTASAGTVMIARVATCPPEGVVYMDVVNVEHETSISTWPCYPTDVYRGLMDEDDEAFAGETYVWLTVDGDYEVTISVETEVPAPLAVEVFADPTPTIVGQEAALDGDVTDLFGVGDTLVYAFDGSASEATSFVSDGMTEACALDAYGAPEVGDGSMWSLAFCGHTANPANGLSSAGLSVPVIVFARSEAPIAVALTPEG